MSESNFPISGVYILEKSVIVYKICRFFGYVVAKLELPIGTVVVKNLYNNELRSNQARVIEILTIDGYKSNSDKCSSLRDPNFIYTVGQTVKSEHKLNIDVNIISASGIYSCETYDEAIGRIF